MGITLQQIAEVCGVSRGTVDRALHGKPGIRPDVAKAVRETAQKMGYIPRRACPVVAKREVRIGVVLHSSDTQFVQLLEGYLRSYPSRELMPLVTIVRTMKGMDVAHQLALIDELVELEQIDGLALMPLANALIRDKINELSEQGIPVVTLNTDISDTNRLAYVGPDLIASGRTAGALMGLSVRGEGTVLPLVGQMNGHYGDSQRVTGFAEELAQNFPHVQVLPLVSCYQDSDMAERIILRALQDKIKPDGIYVTSVGRRGVYRALEKSGMAGKVHVIVHDLTETNLSMIKKGVVDFVVGQDVQTQGTLPLRMLYQYLTKHAQPERRIYITDTDIKFRCNLGDMDVYHP